MATTRSPGRLPRNTSMNLSQMAACLSIKPQAISDFMRKTEAGQSMPRMELFIANGWIVSQGRSKTFTPEGVAQFAKLHGDIMEDATTVVITDYQSNYQNNSGQSTSNLDPESVYAELILSQRKQISELTEEVETLRNKTAEMQLLLDQPSVPQEQYDLIIGERDAALEKVSILETSHQSVQQANCEAITSITTLTEHLNEVREENATLNKQLTDKDKQLSDIEERYEADLQSTEQKHREELESVEQEKIKAINASEQARQKEVEDLKKKAEEDCATAASKATEKAKEEFRNMGFFRRLFWKG